MAIAPSSALDSVLPPASQTADPDVHTLPNSFPAPAPTAPGYSDPLADLPASPAGLRKILSAPRSPHGCGSQSGSQSLYLPALSISPTPPQTLPATACTALSLLPGRPSAAPASAPPLSRT